jgi:hypothetical protein
MRLDLLFSLAPFPLPPPLSPRKKKKELSQKIPGFYFVVEIELN